MGHHHSAVATACEAPTDLIRSAYIHLPFCRRRCFYCDFPVAVMGDRQTSGTERAMGRYVDYLLREIAATAARVKPAPLATVFFGGGTPSLLPVAELGRVLAALDRAFGIEATAELSLEADPGTFDIRSVREYKALGIGRISLGAQAFQDELLERCGRSHRAADILAAVEHLHCGGIENFSLDLISGLPYQDGEQWQASLQGAIALAPAHISCYDLIVEAGTPFSKQYRPGERPLPDDTQTAAMYRLGRELLVAAGYEHYEVSNYAQPGRQCRHNRGYWQLQPFYGFGMGAASYWSARRFSRPRTRADYYTWVEAWEASPTALAVEASSPLDLFLETLMLGLRLAEGVSLATVARDRGPETLAVLSRSLQSSRDRGWVEVVAPDGRVLEAREPLPASGRLRLRDPEGFLFSNTVLAEIFATFEEPA